MLQRRLLLCLYGLGTNTGLKRMCSGGRRGQLQGLCSTCGGATSRKEQLRHAIAQVVNAIFRVRDPGIWGEGTTACASDSKKFGAWDQNLMTEWHVRYGGPGVMIYWHVEKQLGLHLLAAQGVLLVRGRRHDRGRAAPLHRDGGRDGSTSTATARARSAFAFCQLLGFQLLPRLKSLSEAEALPAQRPTSPAPTRTCRPVLTRPINWELIGQQYDEMVKYATALRLGTAEAEAILRRFTRSNVQHPTYRALAELGKAVKTIFLCRYLRLGSAAARDPRGAATWSRTGTAPTASSSMARAARSPATGSRTRRF